MRGKGRPLSVTTTATTISAARGASLMRADQVREAFARGVEVAAFDDFDTWGDAIVGEAGAANAGLFAVAMLARTDAKLAKKLAAFRRKQTAAVRAMKLPVKK